MSPRLLCARYKLRSLLFCHSLLALTNDLMARKANNSIGGKMGVFSMMFATEKY